MSASILPVRIGHLLSWPARTERPARKHRAPDEIERLNAELEDRDHKLAGARMLIKGLHLQLEDLEGKHAEVIARIDERHAETVRGLERELAEAHRRLDIACRANAAADLTQELDTSNLRDNYATGVLTLQQAHCIGPVTDPGRTH